MHKRSLIALIELIKLEIVRLSYDLDDLPRLERDEKLQSLKQSLIICNARLVDELLTERKIS